MRIMIDTNVLISGLVFRGEASNVLKQLFLSEHKLLVSEYILQEFREKLCEKWPEKAETIYDLFMQMDFEFCKSTTEELGTLRDRKDIPVLSDAIYNQADVILSGDKDFLESDIKMPLIFSPAMLIEYLTTRTE